MTTEPIKPASPLPWQYAKTSRVVAKKTVVLGVIENDNDILAEMRLLTSNDASESNAAYIVHAANHFPALVEALERIALADARNTNTTHAPYTSEMIDALQAARAALAAAKGVQS